MLKIVMVSISLMISFRKTYGIGVDVEDAIIQSIRATDAKALLFHDLHSCRSR